MNGFAGNDLLDGGTRNDSGLGGEGDDLLTGGAGRDGLNGGEGKDIFYFNSKADSAKGANRDVILDFSGSGDLLFGEGDKINLSVIDAKKGHGNQAFKYIGAAKFHHKAGELHVLDKGGFFLVEATLTAMARPTFRSRSTVCCWQWVKADFVL
jgi:serralysin